jgi:hypothetical protein
MLTHARTRAPHHTHACAAPHTRTHHTGASEHDLLCRIIETLGPVPSWMVAAAKRANTFFKRVPAPGAPLASDAAAAAGSAGAAGSGAAGAAQPPADCAFVVYSREEFEAVNKCKVCARGWPRGVTLCAWLLC